jgi:hypothetical protein
MLQIDRVKDCLEWLEKTAESYTGQQSITWYIDQLGILCSTMAFVNGQMAEAKRDLNKKKLVAYELLVKSDLAKADYFAPSLAKDYISARIEKEQYEYDLTERCSRTVVHQIDALRSIISSLKEEMKIASYAGQT